jgi:hypothetical protein
MNCPECGHSLTDLRGVWERCARCAELAARCRELAPAMRRLAARVVEVEPPEDLEARLLAEFDAVHQQRARVSRRWMAMVGGALAASVLAGTLVVRQQPAQTQVTASQQSAEGAQFVSIPYTQPLQPYERVSVVETYVPVTALIAAGFAVQTSDPGASVRADVMVGQDGRPRAIRPIAFNISDRRLIP